MEAQNAYDNLLAWSRELARLGSAMAVLGWDQRTFIPAKGHPERAEQLAVLSRIVHGKGTDPRVGDWLAAVEGSDLAAEEFGDVAVNVREWRRSYDRTVKIPEDLAVALTRATSMAEAAWEKTRPANDWSSFKPHLAEVIALMTEKAQAVGLPEGGAETYDALLDDFEPGMTAAQLEPVFAALKEPTVALLDKLKGGSSPDDSVLKRSFAVADQERFGKAVAARLGYDFSGGRLDVTAHPFSTNIAPGDTRITTRYSETDFADAFFGVVHETGHALYSQGQPAAHFGTPRGQSVSLGIHESQSRLWENFVARSAGFWKHFYPTAQAFFPALAGVGEKDFVAAVNKVEPGFIRVQADEVTYNLHVLARFQLELALFRGEVSVDDLPEAWQAAYRELLGIAPKDVASGAMQDVHWSAGLFGYFPTYTLGNLYAAMFYTKAKEDLGDLEAQFAAGDFASLLGWLRENIHTNGRRYSAPRLVREVTGRDLDPSDLITHLETKFSRVYGV